jgi:hypothetical protein
MKKLLVSLAIGFLMIGMVGTASAVVLTFDDIPGVSQNAWGPIGSYGGFNFTTNTNKPMSWIDTVDSTFNFGSVSGDFTMLNNDGGSAIITSSTGSDFTFTGLYTRSWFGYTRSVFIQAFNNGISVWTSTFTLNESWQSIAGSSVIIDELHLNFGEFFLVDNLELNGSGSSPVPEPTTMLLLGFGLVGLAGVRRKFKQ